MSGPAYYVSKEWAIDGAYAPGRMPILMLYRKSLDDAIDGKGGHEPSYTRVYAHYNDPSDKSFPGCPLVYDLDTVSSWIDN